MVYTLWKLFMVFLLMVVVITIDATKRNSSSCVDPDEECMYGRHKRTPPGKTKTKLQEKTDGDLKTGDAATKMMDAIAEEDIYDFIDGCLDVLTAASMFGPPHGAALAIVVSGIYSAIKGKLKEKKTKSELEILLSEKLNEQDFESLLLEVVGHQSQYLNVIEMSNEYVKETVTPEKKNITVTRQTTSTECIAEGFDMLNLMQQQFYEQKTFMATLRQKISTFCTKATGDTITVKEVKRCCKLLDKYAETAVIEQLALVALRGSMAYREELDFATKEFLNQKLKESYEVDYKCLKYLRDPLNLDKMGMQVFVEIYSNPNSYVFLYKYYKTISSCYITERELPPFICIEGFKLCTRLSRNTIYNQLAVESIEPISTIAGEANEGKALLGWEDKVESMFVPANVTVTGYVSKNCEGASFTYIGPAVVFQVDNEKNWKSIKVETTEETSESLVRVCEEYKTASESAEAEFKSFRCWYYGITKGEKDLKDANGNYINTKSIDIPPGLQVWIKKVDRAHGSDTRKTFYNFGPYTGPLSIAKMRDGDYHRTIKVTETPDKHKYMRLCAAKTEGDDFKDCGEISMEMLAKLKKKSDPPDAAFQIFIMQTVNRISFSYLKGGIQSLVKLQDKPSDTGYHYDESVLGSVEIPNGKEIYFYRSKAKDPCDKWSVSGPYGSTILDSIPEDEKYVAFMLVDEGKGKTIDNLHAGCGNEMIIEYAMSNMIISDKPRYTQ